MTPKLTSHVLDNAHGRPAAGVLIRLYREKTLLAECKTNSQGRCEKPLLAGEGMIPGSYRLCFHIGDYFRSNGDPSPFLDVVPIDFRIENGETYHIPLVCTPWGYSTYRGS